MSHTLAIQAWGVSMPGDALACIAGEFLPMCTCLMVGAMGSVVSKAVSPPVFRNPDAAPQRADGIGRTVEWAGMRSIDTGLIGAGRFTVPNFESRCNQLKLGHPLFWLGGGA